MKAALSHSQRTGPTTRRGRFGRGRCCGRSYCRGAALTEMALVKPILLLTFVFLIDYSRAYVVAKAIDSAVSAGAVRGSLTHYSTTNMAAWTSAVEQTIRQNLTRHAWYDDARLTVTVPVPTVNNGLIDPSGARLAQVQVSYTSDYVLGLPGLPSQFTIARALRLDQIR